MTTRSFFLLVLGFLGGLLILLGGVILIDHFYESAPYSSSSAKIGEIGANGPVQIEFSGEMERASIEGRFSTTPDYPGRFEWNGKTLQFFPHLPFKPGTELEYRILSGGKRIDGAEIRHETQWKVTIRENRIIFLKGINQSPQLWVSTPSGSVKSQLTSTDKAVQSFSVSLTGDKVVFSAKNEEGGSDLWLVGVDQKIEEKILSCGTDLCADPAWNSTKNRITYLRWRAKTAQPLVYSPAQVWLIDMDTRDTEELYPGVRMNVHQLTWSPGGRFLAVYDNLVQGIRLFDFHEKKEFFIPAAEGMIGNWSLEEKSLIFTKVQAPNSSAVAAIYRLFLESKEVIPVIEDERDLVEYGVPALNVDGKTVAVSLRLTGGAPTKQIWLIDSLGKKRIPVSNDPLLTYANLQWDSNGNQLVAQRKNISSSRSTPEIVVWERSTGRMVVIAEDAALPAWLP
jgi:hypothetical protein